MVKFERVIDGINRFLNAELYANMNDWQEVFARIAISRFVGNVSTVKNVLMNNPFIQTLAIIDSEGNVDVDGIMRDLREQLAKKERIEFTVPMFGKFIFSVGDVDKLHKTIMEVNNEIH